MFQQFPVIMSYVAALFFLVLRFAVREAKKSRCFLAAALWGIVESLRVDCTVRAAGCVCGEL